MEGKKPKQRKKVQRKRQKRRQGRPLTLAGDLCGPTLNSINSLSSEGEARRVTRSQNASQAASRDSCSPTRIPLPGGEDSFSSGEEVEVVFRMNGQATLDKVASDSEGRNEQEEEPAVSRNEVQARGITSQADIEENITTKGPAKQGQDQTDQGSTNGYAKEGKNSDSSHLSKNVKEEVLLFLENKNEAIMKSLEAINIRLQKLDTLENLNITLKKEVTQVSNRLEEVSSSLGSVKSDLQKHEDKWGEVTKNLLDRMGTLEKGSKSLEKKWTLHRESVANDIKILQSSIDSNSKKAIAVEASLDLCKDKLHSLDELEEKIKGAAEKKFNAIRSAVKMDLGEEILEEVRARSPEVTQEDLNELKEELLGKWQTQNLEVAGPRPPEVTQEDLSELKQEMMEKWATQNKELPEEIKYEMFSDQAFSKRHNLILFGIRDDDSQVNDLTKVKAFFAEQMGLRNLRIHVTYRLGQYRPTLSILRPLVVQFSDIRDRWLVWNNKSRIKYDANAPVRIQEDLPKKLREDVRILHRIAKIAKLRPDTYGEVRVKDYRLNINGTLYRPMDLGKLPSELHPEAVYTPRNSESVIFFTKQSPLSNHFCSDFYLEGQKFSCVEQYLAFAKARLAKNKPMEKRALEQHDPSECKVILNSLRAEIQEKWEEEAPALVLPAIRAKFHQNERLANFLVETYPLSIGEASRDAIWGTGLTLEHRDALDITKWEHRGNLLGYTLEQVRAEIMKNFRENTEVYYPKHKKDEPGSAA